MLLGDDSRNKKLINFNFPSVSKTSILNSQLGFVNEKRLWNQSTAFEDQEQEIHNLEVSKIEIDETVSSEKLMKKEL